ncbi:MAG TPA: large conductance mechanosensitive channel protein MscL [Gemmatimonadaceae bacterium]|nr:large conductance mechanosensitive channel protein MscL [Gemmatimonadaceae bacterium]
MWNDFKAFIMRGNVLDLAVAVVIGAAFGVVVKSLVDDVIMPPIGLLLGHVDFSNLYVLLKDGVKSAPPYASLADAKAAGAVTLNYGMFVNNIITFLIVALAIFLVVRSANKVYKKPAAAVTTKPCPFCAMDIPVAATRCPHCTSELKAA